MRIRQPDNSVNRYSNQSLASYSFELRHVLMYCFRLCRCRNAEWSANSFLVRFCPRRPSSGPSVDCWHTCVFRTGGAVGFYRNLRSEEHTSELQSLTNLVCRLLLEKKKKIIH